MIAPVWLAFSAGCFLGGCAGVCIMAALSVLRLDEE